MKKLLIALIATAPLFAIASTYNLVLDNISTQGLSVVLKNTSNLKTNFSEPSMTIPANSSRTIKLHDVGNDPTRDAIFSISTINTPTTEIKFMRKPLEGDYSAYTSIKEILPSDNHKIIVEEAVCFNTETPETLPYKNCKFSHALRTYRSIPVTAIVKLNIQ